uniref:Uncharacterized protein n=2 Tax=Salix viminalis TaxID=40686 RepID=A0A6N2MHH1_SALVM
MQLQRELRTSCKGGQWSVVQTFAGESGGTVDSRTQICHDNEPSEEEVTALVLGQRRPSALLSCTRCSYGVGRED